MVKIRLADVSLAAVSAILLLMVVGACGSGSAATQTASPTATGTSVSETTAPASSSPSRTPTTAPTPTATPTAEPTPPPFPLRGPKVGYGVNVQLYYTDRQRVLELVKDLGFSYVKQQVVWYDTEGAPGQYAWDELDRVVDSVGENKLQLILSITKAPSWATPDGGHGMPADPSTLGKFMKAMAERYRGKVNAYEIWNEQNTGGETNGNVDAGRYVELLKAGFKAVKDSDPWAIVIYGGLTPTGVMDEKVAIDDVEYLKQSYLYNNGEVKDYFDVLGVHPGGNCNAPDELWPDNPGRYGWNDHPSFYFRRVEGLRAVMDKYGDKKKQVWLTEFGWTTANQAPGYEYGQYVTDELQAKYLVDAFNWAHKNYPWMGVMTVWNLNFSTVVPPSDEKYPWSLIDGDWTPRPAYQALKWMPK